MIANPHNITIEEWPFIFRCPSSRPKILPYRVDARTSRCDCPAGRRRTPCKHVRWVKEYAWDLGVSVVDRMTQSEGGWRLLREFERFVEL